MCLMHACMHTNLRIQTHEMSLTKFGSNFITSECWLDKVLQKHMAHELQQQL